MSFATQLTAAFTPIDAVYDSSAVTRALSFAQSEVEAYCDRVFDLVADDVVYLDPQPGRQALIPGHPIVAISLVRGLLPANGGLTWTEITDYRFVADTGLLYSTAGEPGTQFYGPSWPCVPGGLEVTYTYGYDTVPQGLVDVACRFAQQYLENPALQMQRRIGEQEGRFAGSSGVVFTQLDKQILGRYMDVGIA